MYTKLPFLCNTISPFQFNNLMETPHNYCTLIYVYVCVWAWKGMEKIENGKVYFPRRELYGTLIFVVITLLNFHLNFF